MVGGAVASGVEFVCTVVRPAGALLVVLAVTVAGVWLSMRIPSRVEITAGEVPTTLSYHAGAGRLAGAGFHRHRTRERPTTVGPQQHHRGPVGKSAPSRRWSVSCSCSRVRRQDPRRHRLGAAADAGVVGAAAALGNFAGNFTAARLELGRPAVLVVRCTIAVTLLALAAAVSGKLLVAALATLVTAGASAIAKASPGRLLQHDLPEESRASAFGRSESVLQLAWVLGGALGSWCIRCCSSASPS